MQKVHDSKFANMSENKRKALKDFFTNFYTKKCQKQMKNMTEIKRKIKHYKNNNHQTHTVTIKKLQQISTYQKADDDERKIMKKHEKNKIMQ